MAMKESRRAHGDSHYEDGKKFFVDNRPRPLPDLDLNSITETRYKKWVFHRPRPRGFMGTLIRNPWLYIVAGLFIFAIIRSY